MVSVVRLSVRLSVRRALLTELIAPTHNLVQLITMMKERCLLFFKVGGQRSESYCHIEEKRGRVHCKQDTTVPLVPGSYNLYN